MLENNRNPVEALDTSFDSVLLVQTRYSVEQEHTQTGTFATPSPDAIEKDDAS